jgi:hypothetical protein
MAKKSKSVMPWEAELGGGESEALAGAYARIRMEQEREWTRRSLADAEEAIGRLLTKQPWLDLAIEEGPEYNVEGESGLWSFKTHHIVNRANGRKLHDTRDNLPTQRGTGRFRTQGAQELMLFLGASARPVRECARLLDRIRYQDERKTAATTLRDFAEAEGSLIAEQLKREVDAVMGEEEQSRGMEPPPELHKSCVDTAFADARVPDELMAEARSNTSPLTPPAETAYVSPDAVFCKKQKERRKEDEEAKSKVDDRKTVSVCCATVRADGKRLALVALDYAMLAVACLAALRVNKLVGRHCCLLLDGERKLITAFMEALSKAVGSLHVILDWHHLDKRCSQLLSLALKGKDLRNRHRDKLLGLLWHGCVEAALAYLRAIPSDDIKKQKSIDELITYIGDRKPQIPVYSVRKALGLSNSSNSVEKANDRLVSSRQKGKGMSWSQDGSMALACIRMVDYNGQRRFWLENRTVSLDMAAGF